MSDELIPQKKLSEPTIQETREQILDNLKVPDTRPFVNSVSIQFGGTRTPSLEEVGKAAEWYVEGESEERRVAHNMRVQNAHLLSQTFSMPFESAFQNQDAILRNLYPGEKVSQQTFGGRMRAVYDKNLAQNKINMLRFAQMYGDDSEATEMQIQQLRTGMPSSDRLTQLTEDLMDPDQKMKLFKAFGAVPYVFASQVPMWVDMAKGGVAAASVGGGIGLGTGGPAGGASGAIGGFLLGAGAVEFALEAGGMYDQFIEEAKNAGVELDRDLVKLSATLSSGVIAALDMASFGNIASRVASKSAKELAVAVIKDAGWKRVVSGSAGKQALLAMAEEGVTEGVQEIVGDLGAAWNSYMHEVAGHGELPVPTMKEMGQHAAVAAALAGPMAFLAAGGGSLILETSRATHMRSTKISKERQQSAATAASRAADPEAIDISEDEILGTTPEAAPAETGEKVIIGRTSKTRPVDPGGPVELFVSEGVEAGDYTIHGREETDAGPMVYLKKGGQGSMVEASVLEASAMTGLSEETIVKRANKATRAAQATDTQTVRVQGSSPMDGIRALNRSIPPALSDGQMMVVSDRGRYIATANPSQAAAAVASGARIIGIREPGGGIRMDTAAQIVEDLGWQTDFPTETAAVPDGVKLRAEDLQDGSRRYYYIRDEMEDGQYRTTAEKYAAADREVGEILAEEQAADTALIEEESAVAGGEPGPADAELDAIMAATDVYRPTDPKGKPYGWDAHKRVIFSGQQVNTVGDMAQLFSLYRHPNLEHAHLVFLDESGEIRGNSCFSSGVGAAVMLKADKAALTDQMQRLGAEKVYVVHNHPTGRVNPSQADMRLFADLQSAMGEGYGGAIILNHDHYGWVEPGASRHTSLSYTPRQRFRRQPAKSLGSRDVAMATADRRTAVFVLAGAGQVRAVLTPPKAMDAQGLYDAMRAYGGSFYSVATKDRPSLEHYVTVAQEAQGTNLDYAGRVMLLDEAGNIDEAFKGRLTGDKARLRAARLTALWEDQDPGIDPMPRTVRQYRDLWRALVEEYGLRQPAGISLAPAAQAELSVPGGAIGVSGKIVDGKAYMELDVNDAAGSFQASYVVAQGPDGLTAGLAEGQELNAERRDASEAYARDAAEKVFREGESFNLSEMNLSDEVIEAIEDFDERSDLWKLAPIVKARKGFSVKEKMMLLIEEMQDLDESGLNHSREYRAIQQALWRMGQTHVEMEGISTAGLTKAKNDAADLARGRFTPEKMRPEAAKALKFTGEDVRLPLSKKESAKLKAIRKRPEAEWLPAERELVRYAETPGLENLNYHQLRAVQGRLDNLMAVRGATNTVDFAGNLVALDGAVLQAVSEVASYNPGRLDAISPAEAAERKGVWAQVKEKTKNFIVHRQMKLPYLIEHLGGKNSMASWVLGGALEAADVKFRDLRFDMTMLYLDELNAAGLDLKATAAWASERVERGGVELTNDQAMEILMHKRNEDNWKSVVEGGLWFSDKEGGRHHLSPDAVDFEQIATEMEADQVAAGIAGAFRSVYDELGAQVADTYRSVYGRELDILENYYPKKVAAESRAVEDTDLTNVEVIEGGKKRISLGKAFLFDRLGHTGGLELSVNGAFSTLAVSLEQETRFVHMEKPFYQASQLLYDQDFKFSVTNSKHLGENYYDLIETGLQDWAGRRIDIERTWDSVFHFVRRQATRAALGMNPFTAAKAGISWLYGFRYVDPGHMMLGLKAVASDRKARVQELMERSPVFRDRVLSGALPEVADLLRGEGVDMSGVMPKKGTRKYDEVLFYMLTAVDKHTVAAVMEGAILQAQEAFSTGRMSQDMMAATGLNEAVLPSLSAEEKMDAAVRYAEYVLQRTQPDFRPQSRSQFQRGTSFERLASVFGSFVNVTHSMFFDTAFRIRKEGLDGVGVKDMVFIMSLMMAVQMGNEGVDAVKNALLGRDQAGVWEMVSRGLFNSTFVVRDINQMMISKFKYGAYAGAGTQDSFTRFMNLGGTGVANTIDGLFSGDDQKVLKGFWQMTQATASFAGAPVVTFGYGVDLVGGED